MSESLEVLCNEQTAAELQAARTSLQSADAQILSIYQRNAKEAFDQEPA